MFFSPPRSDWPIFFLQNSRYVWIILYCVAKHPYKEIRKVPPPPDLSHHFPSFSKFANNFIFNNIFLVIMFVWIMYQQEAVYNPVMCYI